MSILVHTCCGPCLGGSAAELRRQHDSLILFWENFNIHPYLEYRSRLEAFHQMAGLLDLPVAYGIAGYGLEKFLQTIGSVKMPLRCESCYRVRLESAAAKARHLGCEAFTTTLSISPFQKHDLIQKVGIEVSQSLNIPFVYHDLRPFFSSVHEAARENNLYKQRYCGCIFSEFERFQHDPKHPLPECLDDSD